MKIDFKIYFIFQLFKIVSMFDKILGMLMADFGPFFNIVYGFIVVNLSTLPHLLFYFISCREMH